MPRYERQKKLLEMIDQSSLSQVIDDLVLLSLVKAEEAREQSRYCTDAVRWDEHAMTLEVAKKMIDESDERAERRVKFDEENP